MSKFRSLVVATITVPVVTASITLTVHGRAAAGTTAVLDDDTFAACATVRELTVTKPAASDLRALARAFAGLTDRTARRALASALRSAAGEKLAERRRALTRAQSWCERSAGAYQTVVLALTVPSVVDVVDTAEAVITGTATPGATVTARATVGGSPRTWSATADPSGAFTLVATDLPLGEVSVSVGATAALRYPSAPKTVVVRRSESEGAYKASAREIPSDELKKDPAGLRGTRIYSRGEVLQYDSRTGLTAMLVYVRVVNPGRYEFWTDPVLLRLSSPAQGTGIDEDDIIDFWGEVEGPYSYSTAIGGSNTVPAIRAKYVALVEKR